MFGTCLGPLRLPISGNSSGSAEPSKTLRLIFFFLSFCRLHPCFFYGWISGLMAVNIVFFWP